MTWPMTWPPTATSRFKFRPGDLDIDRSAGGQTLFEQARLLGDDDRSGQLADPTC